MTHLHRRRFGSLALCVTLVAGGLLVPGLGLAADWLMCNADLTRTDCTSASNTLVPGCDLSVGTWGGETLTVTASCTPCSGGGADIQCSPEEKVLSGANLYLATPTFTAVPGSFTQVKTCDFGINLWRFSGSLAVGDYVLMAKVSGFSDQCLFKFTVGSVVPPAGDLGTSPPKVDFGGPVPKNEAGLPLVDSSVAHTGDGAGQVIEDEGCGCRVSAVPPLELSLLLLLAMPLLARAARRQRRR